MYLCQALGRLREEAHRQARSAIEPLSQVELTQAGRRLLDKVRGLHHPLAGVYCRCYIRE